MHQQLLQIVTQQFGLQVVEQRSPLLSPKPAPIGRLLDRLEGGIDLIYPNTNEKTRAEVVVAPILLHLAFTYQLSLYCGEGFNIDLEAGLSGTVDHLFSRANPGRSTIQPAITTVIETKSNRYDTVSHCLVQMVSFQHWNASTDIVYGVVTTGLMWRFLKLEGTTVTIDLTDYPLFPIHELLSILAPMVSQKSWKPELTF